MIDQKLDYSLPTRFAENSFHKNLKAPKLKHFIPLLEVSTNIPRDRFSNRMITSSEKAYFDREGNETKAALLISPEGEIFIKTHKDILDDIDRGLRELNWESRNEKPIIDLGNNRRIGFLTGNRGFKIRGGNQSEIYVLEIGTEKYLIKKKTTKGPDAGISQPFINEMLQCQALATDLKNELNESRVVMPTFLFASGQVACKKFEDGKEINPSEFAKEIQKLAPIIAKYLKKMKEKGVDLWKNIEQDMFFFPNPNYPAEPNDSWLIRKDGKLVTVDPFYYSTRR